MKKILLLLLLLVSLPLYNNMVAQCVVKNVIVKVNSSSPSATLPGYCDINYDFIFTIENNGGNKFIYLHAWMNDDYPNYFNCPLVPSNAKAPVAGDLVLSKINFGIHNEIHAGHPEPTLVNTYYPDPTVVLTTASGLDRFVYPTGDSARFLVKGIQITVPFACSETISMKADLWSSQSQFAQNAQCVYCNLGFTIDPRINGLINCAIPRTFNVIISSVADFPITGMYEVYLDYPSNPLQTGSVGTYGPEDSVLVYSSAYTTVLDGGFNRYVATNLSYLYNSVKPQSDKNLWVVVSVTGYPNKAINLLMNSCSPLPLKLTDFKVEKTDQGAKLTWATDGETNTNGFYVERKIGGTEFTSVGFVQAESLNSEITSFVYNFTDPVSLNGSVIFYRLKMVDNDGKYTYSDIRAIKTNGGKMYLLVRPNPSKGTFIVDVPTGSGVYDLSLCDLSGRVVKNLYGLNNQTLHVNNLLPGVYILKINFRESGEIVSERIIIQ